MGKRKVSTQDLQYKEERQGPVNYILTYYQQIKNGSICVGQWIERLYTKIIEGIESKEYILDLKKANDAIEWIENHCYHTEGPLAPGPFLLELWQKAIVSCIFGVCDPDTGKRMFREVALIVARKNGKSLFAAALAKYVFYVDGGYGARVYCTAPRLDQTDIIYDSVWLQIQLDPEWQEEEEEIRNSIQGHNRKAVDDSFHAKKRMKDIFIPGTNSSIKKIAFNDKKSDGFNPSLVICDEIASWQGDKGLKQYEVWKSAGGSREMGDNPPILLSCSTSGYINDSAYDEIVKRGTRFLLGDSKEKRLLPFLYMIDDVEKWNDINELRKSNPNLGVSVSVDYMLEEIAIAEGSLSKKTEFLTKYCCIKQNSSLAWLSSEAVDKTYGNEFSLEDFRSSYCVAGIDLSQTTDLTACTLVIERDGQLYVFGHFFLPGEKIEEATQRDGVPYQIYIQRGLLTPSGQNFIDYRDCYEWFTRIVEEYEILPLMVGYDRYSAQYLIKDMEAYGFKTDSVFQGENLYGVIQETEGLIKDGKVHIGTNDLLKAHLLNSAIKMSAERGRGRLIKLNASLHIDGVASLLCAMTVRQKWYAELGDRLVN